MGWGRNAFELERIYVSYVYRVEKIFIAFILREKRPILPEQLRVSNPATKKRGIDRCECLQNVKVVFELKV